jgi:hypothetical protein
MELLESREYLSATPFDPTPEQMELLELINQMRMDPQGELGRIFSEINDKNLTARNPAFNKILQDQWLSYPKAAKLLEEWEELRPAAPLAWNPSLAEAAVLHSQLMIDKVEEGHRLSSEKKLEDRVTDTGYYNPNSGDNLLVRENISAHIPNVTDSDYGTLASYIHQFFVIDFGNPKHEHRDNVMNAELTDIGIGLLSTDKNNFGPWVVTVDFGSVSGSSFSDGAYLMGLVYDDANGDRVYQAGEGLPGMNITVKQGDVVVYEVNTLTAGAYQEYLENGTYTVTVSGEGFDEPITKTVTINGSNEKLDFRSQETENQKPQIHLNGQESGGDSLCGYTENSEPVRIIPETLVIVDQDSPFLNQAKAVLTNIPDGLYESLSVDTTGTALSWNYHNETGVLTISGLAPTADYVKVLKTLSYHNARERCQLEDRIVEVSVSDEQDFSDIVTSTIRIHPSKQPIAAIEDVRVIEGDDDTAEMIFIVELDEPARRDITIRFNVIPGTAQVNMDYEPVTASPLTIAEGDSSAQIVIKVKGDYLYTNGLDEKTLTVQINDYENVEIAKDSVTGTILEDDKIIDLGRISTAEFTDLEFTEGVRRLYSFQAASTGRVSWDAYMDALPAGVKITYYLGSHAQVPQASSAVYMNHQHLEFDITEGLIYVVKVEWTGDSADGNILPVDRLKMTQIYKTSEDWLEIQGDQEKNEFTLDLNNHKIGINNEWGDYDWSQFPWIRFLPNAQDSIRIIGGGDPIVILPDNSVIEIGGIQVDVSGFQEMSFYGTPDLPDSISFTGTDGDDIFIFKDGIGTFITDQKVYKTYNIEEILVDAKGGHNLADIYDTPEDDTFSLYSEKVTLEGGGYYVEALSFHDVTMTSVAGGKETACLYGETDSLITIDSVYATRRQADQYYKVWNCPYVIAVNNDGPSSSVILNGSGGDDIYTNEDGYIKVTDKAGTYLHEVKGFTSMVIIPSQQTATVSVPETWVLNTENSVISSSQSRVYYRGVLFVNYWKAAAVSSSAAAAAVPSTAALPDDDHPFTEDRLMALLAEEQWRPSRKNPTQSDDWMAEFERLAVLETMSRERMS